MARLSRLAGEVEEADRLSHRIHDLGDLLDLTESENDDSLLVDVTAEAGQISREVERLDLRVLLSGDYAENDAILSIHAGAGGTESQDWAQMLMRMYIRWAETHKYKVDIVQISEGEEAGIKSADLEISGPYAYGYLRAERGVHRLVRLSPYDSAHRRHTSFSLVEVMPATETDEELAVNPDDLRIDTYRSTGAGGQHVNKTESAVRITHIPSGIVVACQNERSQHKNRSTAMKMLKAKLYELEVNKRNAAAKVLEDAKSDVSWGNQIRSYVLDQSRIKDLRTGIEVGNTQAVLDGDLDPFLEASLKAGV